jgi:hypothetical protein
MAWSKMRCKGGSSILKGLRHLAQGCPIPRGLPWVAPFNFLNPERVEDF